MIDPASLRAAFESLKFAGQLVKVIVSEHDASVIKERARELTGVIIEAQSQTLDAQTQLSQANEEIRELKARIAKLDKWEEIKQLYELVQPAPGVFAYQLNADARGQQPLHQICPKCYEDDVASILQAETTMTPIGTLSLLVCPRCKTEIVLEGWRNRK